MVDGDRPADRRGEKNFSWDNAKKMMAKVDAFKEKLENYDGRTSRGIVKRVQPILDDPEFNFTTMKGKSSAAANLCNWVINIINYNSIFKRVKPLMDSLRVASEAKKKAEDDLAVVQEKLDVIAEKLAGLQSQFMDATQEKAKVEEEAQKCLDRLDLATRLTSGLASEKVRWGTTVDQLKQEEITLAGRDGGLVHKLCGCFGIEYRKKL